MSGRIKAINPEIIVKGCADKPYYQIKYYDKADNLYHYGFGSYDYGTVLLWLRDYFEPIQAEEQPVVHGHWEETDETVWDEEEECLVPLIKCSVCSAREREDEDCPYCRRCGAKMELEEDNQ